MTQETLHQIEAAVFMLIITFLFNWVNRALKVNRKKSENNHRLIMWKVDSIDHGLSTMNGTERNREISTAYKHARDEFWETKKKEHDIKNEGLN